MRYIMLAIVSLSLVSPVLVGCESNSDKEVKTTHNPITGSTTTTEKSSSSVHSDSNNP